MRNNCSPGFFAFDITMKGFMWGNSQSSTTGYYNESTGLQEEILQ